MAKKPKAVKKSGATDESLETLRAQIDALDVELVALINRRATVATRIGQLKARDGRKAYAPSREKQVYERVGKLNQGPLPAEAFRSIYREIMSATIALEHPTRVCYFGKEGSNTHAAARSKFGSSVEYISGRDLRDVFLHVTRGWADYGLVPIENSTEGGVNQSIDLLAETRLKVASEIYLPIHHHLLSYAGLKEIKIVYSHPQAFAQCRTWMLGHMAEVERKEVGSTSEAAEMAAKDHKAAAIAGGLAAEIYKVPIIEHNIEDQQDNITRFFVLSEQASEPTGNDKTSLVVSLKDAPGALLRLLEPFQRHGINLSRIESRPNKRKAWEYNFFIDLHGHFKDAEVAATLKELEICARHLEVLGSYPSAPRVPGKAG